MVEEIYHELDQLGTVTLKLKPHINGIAAAIGEEEKELAKHTEEENLLQEEVWMPFAQYYLYKQRRNY